MIETRLISLGLLIVRIVAGAFTLVPIAGAASATPAAVALMVKAGIGVWIALSFCLFMLERPHSRLGYHLVAVADLAFCLLLLIGDAPFASLPLLALHCIAWGNQGFRGLLHPVLPLYVLGWIIWWTLHPTHMTLWFQRHPSPSDFIKLVLLVTVASLTAWMDSRRQRILAALGSENDPDGLQSIGAPFSYDFSSWIAHIVQLYGRNSADCTVCILSRQGVLNSYANDGLQVPRASLDRYLREELTSLPDRLSVIEAGKGTSRVEAAAMPKIATLLPHRRATLLARRFTIAGQSGMMLLSIDLPVDPVLTREAHIIDDAFDMLIRRAASAIEMRRSFLAEAREVARRDLHDGVLQSLAAIRMRLSVILRDQRIVDSGCVEDIRTTANIISLEQARLRLLLESSVNDDAAVNLVEALRLCISTIALQWEVDVDFVTDELAIPMQREAANNVEFLLREAVANATRHSSAKRISCTLAIKDSDLVLSLVDSSGQAAEEKTEGGQANPLASQSLKHRLGMVNGRAYFEGLKKGTLLAINIPLMYEDS